MSTAENNYEHRIYRMLKSPRDDLYNELDKNWTERIKNSNDIINKINSNENYITNNLEKIFNEIDLLNNALDYYTELGINEEELSNHNHDFRVARTTIEKNYRTLSLKYYKYMYDRFEDTRKRTNNSQNKQKNIEKKIFEADKKIESLGGVFLNIVLTISIVSSMIAILTKIRFEYLIPVSLICSWLLLSSIIFISEYFKNPLYREKDSFARKIYYTLSIITVISFIIPLSYNAITKRVCMDLSQNVYIIGNNSAVHYANINDKSVIENFMSNFIVDWENNDANFYKYKEYLNNDNINNIIFYKYHEDNIDIYKFELFLLNGKLVTFKTDNEQLKEWIENNNIIE